MKFSIREFSDLKSIIMENARINEIRIAIFRIILILTNLVLVFLILSGNRFQISASDSANLSVLIIALLYTCLILFYLTRPAYHKIIGWLSSALDIGMITVALYFSRYSSFSSIASLGISSTYAIYFPIILFSLSRHSPRNTLFTGLLASLCYSAIIIIMQVEQSIDVILQSSGGLIIRTNLINEIVKAVMLLISGIIGYFVAQNYDRLFYQMVTKEKEVESIRKSFGSYVSNELVDLILSRKISIYGERKEVSILFIDIHNFTKLSEVLEPRVLIQVLNAYFEFAIDIILKHNGFIDKFIGDAIMVQFGTPQALVNHRKFAIDCALELIDKKSVLQKKIESIANLDWPFDFGIGVNTGEVVSGNVGTLARMEYTSLGDTVNIAARLEAATRDLKTGLAIGINTYLKEYAELFEGPTPIKLKGKSDSIAIYYLKS